MSVVTLAVVGAGDRGTGYAAWASEHPDRARVVAVAEPRDVRRERFAATHRLDHVYRDWRELAAAGRVADAVVIATQDALHLEPALAFADLGYHILLEKPIAPSEADCRRIIDAVSRAGVLFAVGHVMRYTRYTRTVKSLLDAGRLGRVVSVQHLEPVGFWHYAHSFVRGNWRNSEQSTFMLLAKSCHDLDWLQHVIGRPIRRVASFGTLTEFTPANRPEGAADRCLDCPVEPTCAYSAKRFYFHLLHSGRHGWPLRVVVDDPTEAALTAALRDGPYGRCVYACDNDVVDHQVVALEFEGGLTGTFTMTGCTEGGLHRQTRIFGSGGELIGDGEKIRVYDFRTGTAEVIDAHGGSTAGHGGGDEALMDAFVRAVATGDARHILSGPDETLGSHLAVFAAERARRTGTVVSIPDLGNLPSNNRGRFPRSQRDVGGAGRD